MFRLSEPSVFNTVHDRIQCNWVTGRLTFDTTPKAAVEFSQVFFTKTHTSNIEQISDAATELSSFERVRRDESFRCYFHAILGSKKFLVRT